MSELPAGYLLRRPESADAGEIVALQNACDVADVGRPDSTLEDLSAGWALPRFDRSRDAWVVVAEDRSIVGYAWIWDRDPHADFQADLYVHPNRRMAGIEDFLLRIIEERGIEHVTAAPAGKEVSLGIFSPPAGALAALLGSRGYARVRTFLTLTIDLQPGFPTVNRPEGIEIRFYRPGFDELTIHQIIEEAFAHHFRFTFEPHDEWISRRVGHPKFDPSLWLIAWDGAEAAGAILPYQVGELSWIRELGVRARWRGLGIGKALLLEAFRAFVQRGQYRVSLGVDAENASGATRLYQGVGMHEEQRHDLYGKILRPGG